MSRVPAIVLLVACLTTLLPAPAPARPAPPAPARAPAPPASVALPVTVAVAGSGPATKIPVEVSAPAAPDYRWPMAGEPVVTRRFDPPAQRWLPGHRGVDLAGSVGATVYAAGSGTVFFAGTVAGRGVLSVDHPGGLRTTYQPVAALVEAGETVAAGDPIAVLDPGHDGCPVAACLHWGLRRGESYLDPLLLLGLGRVRLLPLR